MPTLTVRYSPTASNKSIITKMAANPELAQHQFRRLSYHPAHRKNELQELELKTVFIWGDGKTHDESHHFTLGKIKGKINLDAHEDDGSSREPDYGTHMAHTKKSGVTIFTPADTLASLDSGIDLMSRFGRGEVGVTVDLDVLRRFPAREAWVSRRGLAIENACDALRRLGNRVGYLDFGGLVEKIPEFSRSSEENIHIPTVREAVAFGKPWAKMREDEKTRVGIYVLEAYSRLIKTFQECCFE